MDRGEDQEKLMKKVYRKARDNGRSPMQVRFGLYRQRISSADVAVEQ
jgi:hypothetical protein